MRRVAILAVLAMAGTAQAGSAQTGLAQTAAPEITISGQMRPRMETRSTSDRSDEFVTMRARAAVRARAAAAVSVFLEMQDVRLWGDELVTTSNPDHIELHQGYIDLGAATAALSGRVGRQEAVYGEERLIGASDWVQQARAFDGARARYTRGRIAVDGFAYQIADAADPAARVNERFVGSYATLSATPFGNTEAYALHNAVSGTRSTRQTTLGARINGARGAFSYRVEAATQNGTRAGADLSSYMGAARATLTGLRGAGQLTLWYDYLSGDDDPADNESRVFDTVYGTNHKFYGNADIFTNIPVHTASRGLQDIALKSSFAVTRDVSVTADLHQFRAAAGRGLASSDFGREADVTAGYRYSPRLMVNAGVSYYATGDGMAAIQRPVPSQAFTYIMLNATF